jgi:hypothetical protein
MAIPDCAYDCFTYIINTRKTYDLLGESLRLFLRRVQGRRRKKQPKQVVEEALLNGIWDCSLWSRRLREAIQEAAKDFRKCFPDELPDNAWIGKVREVDVMRIALEHKDQWDAAH